jgi:PAS domain S-box-containing protein
MTLVRARQVGWLALALAILALGFEAEYVHSESPTLLGTLFGLLRTPTLGALLLIAASFAMRALHHGAASVLCGAAAVVWAMVGLLESIARQGGDPGMAPEEVAIASVACLALGVTLDALVAKTRLGYATCATLLFVAAVGGAASLVALQLPGSTEGFIGPSMPALACVAFSLLGLRQLFRPHDASLDSAVARLHVPIAISGVAGTLACAQLIAHNTAVKYTEQLGWMIAAGALMLCVTMAAFTIARLVAEVMLARRSTTKWQRLLRRQREIMHGRTAALRRTQVRYRDLFANVPAPVILTNAAGAILAANPAMLHLLGAKSEDELKAMNMGSLHADPEQRRKLLATWAASDESIHQGEFKLRRLDGEQRSALYTSHVLRLPKAAEIEYIQGTFTDITELRKAEANQRTLEATLRLSQKLESVGRLAAGIAHEINTPMQYIGDNVFYLRESYQALQTLLEQQRQLLADIGKRSARELAEELRELESDADIAEILEAVPGAFTRTDDGIKSVNRIVAAMKELAHPGEGSKASTDVNAVINTAVTVTRNAHKTVAKVELNLGDIPNALAYKNELCQVFINLIVNAAHAIESAQKADHRAGSIKIRTHAADDAIFIDVSDNGCGIQDSVMDKIFDPFFTTKEVGKGTGQGLALARTTIIEKHGGQIAVQSTVGQGSTFTITLPIRNHDSTSNREDP